MATYPLTAAWSDPITVPAGAIIQNKGCGTILVTASLTANDADALELPQHQAVRAESGAVTVRARGFARGARLGVIEGF